MEGSEGRRRERESERMRTAKKYSHVILFPIRGHNKKQKLPEE